MFNVFDSDVHHDNVPCAVCLATSRSLHIMLPGTNQCYPGWRREYWGYLMTAHRAHNGRTEYICVHGHAAKSNAVFRNDRRWCTAVPCG